MTVALSRPDAKMGRRHRGRGPRDRPLGPAARGSLMIHVRHATAAIASGLCKTVLITHGKSGRSGVGRTPQCHSTHEPRRSVRAALWTNGTGDFVHDPGTALREDLRPNARAVGKGLGCAARMGGQEPARHLQDADRRRGCAELADDCLPVPLITVLPGDRWRRCLDPDRRRARPRLPAKAGLPPRHR